jgi:hypothetical protein
MTGSCISYTKPLPSSKCTKGSASAAFPLWGVCFVTNRCRFSAHVACLFQWCRLHGLCRLLREASFMVSAEYFIEGRCILHRDRYRCSGWHWCVLQSRHLLLEHTMALRRGPHTRTRTHAHASKQRRRQPKHTHARTHTRARAHTRTRTHKHTYAHKHDFAGNEGENRYQPNGETQSLL